MPYTGVQQIIWRNNDLFVSELYVALLESNGSSKPQTTELQFSAVLLVIFRLQKLSIVVLQTVTLLNGLVRD
jgi:hypothetical protein